jgi:hypothetical protein
LPALAVAAGQRVLRPDYVLVGVGEEGLESAQSAEVKRFGFFVFLEVPAYTPEFVDGDDYVEVVSGEEAGERVSISLSDLII